MNGTTEQLTLFEIDQQKKVRKIIKNTVKLMTQVHTYKIEFDPIIKIYARICAEYEYLSDKFMKDRFKFDEQTDTGGTKKSPLVTTLETYRKDIISYASQLGLTPSGLNKINDTSMKPPKKKSLFENVEDLEK